MTVASALPLALAVCEIDAGEDAAVEAEVGAVELAEVDAVTLFEPLGGVVAALAESIEMMIAGRALQGCGAVAGVALLFLQ